MSNEIHATGGRLMQDREKLLTASEEVAAGRQHESAEAALMTALSDWEPARLALGQVVSEGVEGWRGKSHELITAMRPKGDRQAALRRLAREDVEAMRLDLLLRAAWLGRLRRDFEGDERLGQALVHERERVRARDSLMLPNVRLVSWRLAKFLAKFPHLMRLREDLAQEGQIALMRCVERFDPEMGHRFTTLATGRISQALAGAAARLSGVVELPLEARRKRRQGATQSNGARLLYDNPIKSPGAWASDEGTPDLMDAFGHAGNDPELAAETDEVANAVNRWLGTLPLAEREAVSRYYGFGRASLNNRTVGNLNGLAGRDVSDLQANGLAALQVLAESEGWTEDDLPGGAEGGASEAPFGWTAQPLP